MPGDPPPASREGAARLAISAVAALAFNGAGGYCLAFVFPISGHADDWPGPYVGAAFSLMFAAMLSFIGLLLGLVSWRPPEPTRLAWAALLSAAAIYAGVGITFPFVGLTPFCGASAAALENGGPAPSLLVSDLMTGCGGVMLAAYFVPLMIAGALLFSRIGRARRRAPGVA